MHHADAVRERERLLLVVRDEDRGDAELALDLANGPAQFLADLGVERAEGLVQQQHLRPVRKRARHGHALLLPAGELRRQAIVHALERHEPQQLLASRASLGRAHPAHPERELDVVRHGHVPEQRVVLEDEADLALARRNAGDVAAVQRRRARGRSR